MSRELIQELRDALFSVHVEAVSIGAGENAISDAARAKVDAAIASATAALSQPSDERALFEAWVRGWGVMNEQHRYTAWEAWQARAALSAPARVPPEIVAIAERLHTQDNRITDNPLFAVQQMRRVYGVDADYRDGFVWVDYDGELCEESPSARKVGYVDRWEFITGCLTEQGCKDYIKANGHNLHEPRIYAYGSYRNAEFIALRKWLMSLHPGITEQKEPECPPGWKEMPGLRAVWLTQPSALAETSSAASVAGLQGGLSNDELRAALESKLGRGATYTDHDLTPFALGVEWAMAQAAQPKVPEWRAPGPVTADHPLECLIVVESVRQSDGDWLIKGSHFLPDDFPLAWLPDNDASRALFAASPSPTEEKGE
jgi:hypothetical protein